MLTIYSPNEVHKLAERLDVMVRALRVIEGRMLSGHDVAEVGWNDGTFLLRLGEIEEYFEGMTAKYERESLKLKRKKEKAEAERKRGAEVAKRVADRKSGENS